MEKYFVTYDQALALRELGFDEYCFKYQLEGYSPNVKTCRVPGYLELIKNSELNETSVAMPLKQQIFEFFKNKYRLFGRPDYFMNDFYCFTINDMKDLEKSRRLFTEFETYEEAEFACINKLIELAKE